MLYFAYGSNLNWHQMKKERCPGSKYIQPYILKGYKLIFSHRNPNNKYGHANIEKNKNFYVPGAIWSLTKKHEKILDHYEQYPDTYQKEYFCLDKKKIMFYIMSKYYLKKPPKSYIDTINEGYKNCNIDFNITY